MRIRFETTIEDIVAFNRFHCENSPMVRRQRLVVTLIMPLLLGIAAWFGYQSNGESDVWIYAIAISVLWCVGIQLWLPWRTAQNARKLLSEGSNRGVIGWREMDLVNNRLIVKLELIDSSYDLRAIEKIVSDNKYTYVYVSSIQAFMIPLTLYPEHEYREFVAELLDAWDNRDAPRPEARPVDERILERPV